MIGFTKERIEQFIKNPLEHGLTRSEQMEMARQLLASVKQEPVAYMHHSGQVVTREECCDDKIFAICCKVETPLYAAPQLPLSAVVDDDKFRADFERWMVEDEKCIVGSSDPYPAGIESRNWRAWSACRAAMLQAGNHTEQYLDMIDHSGEANEKGNSPVTPDGWQLVPKEPTVAMNKAGWAAINEHDEINPTYRAMLAAAPQQELK